MQGRDAMGKPECAEFLKYQGRYDDFSTLFILTAFYQRDFVDNPGQSNTNYSYPAKTVLQKAYTAHQDYQLIVGYP